MAQQNLSKKQRRCPNQETETMKCTAEQAMAALKIPEADKGKYIAKL